jgi:hypothetical protein
LRTRAIGRCAETGANYLFAATTDCTGRPHKQGRQQRHYHKAARYDFHAIPHIAHRQPRAASKMISVIMPSPCHSVRPVHGALVAVLGDVAIREP